MAVTGFRRILVAGVHGVLLISVPTTAHLIQRTRVQAGKLCTVIYRFKATGHLFRTTKGKIINIYQLFLAAV